MPIWRVMLAFLSHFAKYYLAPLIIAVFTLTYGEVIKSKFVESTSPSSHPTEEKRSSAISRVPSIDPPASVAPLPPRLFVSREDGYYAGVSTRRNIDQSPLPYAGHDRYWLVEVVNGKPKTAFIYIDEILQWTLALDLEPFDANTYSGKTRKISGARAYSSDDVRVTYPSNQGQIDILLERRFHETSGIRSIDTVR